MSFVAVAIGGSALVAGGAAIIGSGKAAGAQRDAANTATQTTLKQLAQQQQQYETDRADLAPYREAGYTALGQLAKGTADGGEFNRNFTIADYTEDPGYKFRLDQGQRGVEASAAARGGVLSGATMKAIARYNSGVASQEYGASYDRYRASTTDRFNRLANVAGVGQQATNAGIAAAGTNSAAQAAGAASISNNALAVGNARASQYAAGANAIGSAANSVGQYFALRDLYKFNPSAGGGAYGVAGSDGIY